MLCETVTDGDGEETLEPWSFKVPYDKLIIAAGAEATTFGIRGVKEHAIFLREVYHAQEIRRKLLLNLMLSDVPGTPLLLQFMVQIGRSQATEKFYSSNLVGITREYSSFIEWIHL